MNLSSDKRGDILIVDDTPDNLRFLSTMLTEQKYEVRSVKNGSSALMGVQAQPPDLILLDITMPDMDGYQVCQRLKANPKTQAIPIIFISALSESFDKVKAFAVGGVDYITKPFQVEEVLARVEHQLAIRRLQTQLMNALAQEQALNQRIEELATLEERNRIARDIHDSLGHILVALNIQMETALALWANNTHQAHQFLVEARKLGAEALKAVRQSVGELRSEQWNGQFLETAIAKLAQEFHSMMGILPITEIALNAPVSQQVGTVIYRIVQESLTNICKYAGATSVQIQIQSTDTGLQVKVCDNGQGFRVDAELSGYGLQGMYERISSLNGHLEIISQPGQGCQIIANLPKI
ncbi:response regulator [Chroococcus sp. FPU101]|uniref:ATP-binding response regulator n=1 Tax=Chroococcus sp. FPU101 TaxID=1974212 RepID=UPI001A8E8FE1|nr:response regulator [Chroococcus sp. FPU101]GFE68802.1 response regulator receiver sensor signal transduction histidine kinase [Chroococcus sp. FPU101]